MAISLEAAITAFFAGLVVLVPVLAHQWIKIHRATRECGECDDDDEDKEGSA